MGLSAPSKSELSRRWKQGSWNQSCVIACSCLSEHTVASRALSHGPSKSSQDLRDFWEGANVSFEQTGFFPLPRTWGFDETGENGECTLCPHKEGFAPQAPETKKPLTRVSKRVPGAHGKRVLERGWQKRLAKGWRGVSGFPCTLQFRNSRGARLETLVCDFMVKMTKMTRMACLMNAGTLLPKKPVCTPPRLVCDSFMRPQFEADFGEGDASKEISVKKVIQLSKTLVRNSTRNVTYRKGSGPFNLGRAFCRSKT